MFVGTIHAFCLELLKNEVPAFLKFEVLNEVQQGLFTDRHSQQSGLTASTDLAGHKLKRYIDTSHYLSALAIIREADVVDSVVKECSVVAGLESYRALLSSAATSTIPPSSSRRLMY
jgi:DNA helicase-2/ATP-dependent DNA helicase PcrA